MPEPVRGIEAEAPRQLSAIEKSLFANEVAEQTLRQMRRAMNMDYGL